MKKTLLILLAFLLLSCSKAPVRPLWCAVELEAVLPGGTAIRSISVDSSLPGNFIRNLNTGEEYAIPAFVSGRASLQVLKGYYLIAFDGEATLSDGSVVRVRSAQYNSTTTAAALTDNAVRLELTLLRR